MLVWLHDNAGVRHRDMVQTGKKIKVPLKCVLESISTNFLLQSSRRMKPIAYRWKGTTIWRYTQRHGKKRKEKGKMPPSSLITYVALRRGLVWVGGRGDGGGDFGGRAPQRRNDASKSREKIEIAPNLDLVPNVGLRNSYRT